MKAQKAELEKQRALKLQQAQEEKARNEKLRQESQKQTIVTQKTEMVSQKMEQSSQRMEQSSQKMEQFSHLEEVRKINEQRNLERQRLEMMVAQESKMVSSQVAKRSDDVHGQGWGNVTTGFVNRTKLGFLQRASMDRDLMWEREGSAAPSSGSVRRVTWADSPASSRPDSRLQEVDTLHAQTPPLAGEWAVARSGENNVSSQRTFTQQSGGMSKQTVSSSAAFQSPPL